LSERFYTGESHDRARPSHHVAHRGPSTNSFGPKVVASERDPDGRRGGHGRHGSGGEVMDMSHIVVLQPKWRPVSVLHHLVASRAQTLGKHLLGRVGYDATVLGGLAEYAANQKDTHGQRRLWRDFRRTTGPNCIQCPEPVLRMAAMRPRVPAQTAPPLPSEDPRTGEGSALVGRRSLISPLDPATLAPLVIGLLALVLYAASPNRDRFYSAIPAVLSFALAPALFSSVRTRINMPLCPVNWVLFLFLFQLVVDPLLICYGGPFLNTLPMLPSDDAVNASMLVSVLAWIAFVAGSEIALRWKPGKPRFSRVLISRHIPEFAPNKLALAFALVGVVGLGLAFHSPHALLDYFHRAGGHVGVENQTNSGAVQSLSVLLRPFLAFALIIPWCGWIDRRRSDQRLLWRTLAIMTMVLLASATYSYNRASAVAPLVAMLSVYSLRVLRLRFWVLLVGVVLALGLLTAVRAYRNTDFTVSQAITSASARHSILEKVNLDREIQIYASAPQYLGYLLERSGWGDDPHYGRTLLSSALSPIPRLGRAFRTTSGTAIYNHLIYGERSSIADQVAPFEGELFLDFALAGVLAGFLCLAFAFRLLQGKFERSTSAFAAFAWQYGAIWLGFLVIGSLAVVSQIAIYFFWPIVVFGLLSAASSGRHLPDGLGR
jgi:hypothetical protein